MTNLLLGLAAFPFFQKVVEFSHSPSNLKFTIPSDATITKKKDEWTITLPLGGAGRLATVKVFSVSFMAAPDVWESAQKYFAEQQKLVLLDQSREEFGGIPLILSRMQNNSNSGRPITESGMFYGATEFKMAYRLTADESSFADAQTKWKDVLLSIRPIDGKMPNAEIPGRATEAPATKKRPPKVPEVKRVPIGVAPPAAEGPVIGALKLSTQIAGKEAVISIADGWKLTLGEAGKILAEHIASKESFTVEVFSSLDSPTMLNTYQARIAAGLNQFSVVKERIEPKARMNKAGVFVVQVMRIGEGDGKQLVQSLAGGDKGDFYWIVEQTSSTLISANRQSALALLIDTLSIEPKQ